MNEILGLAIDSSKARAMEAIHSAAGEGEVRQLIAALAHELQVTAERLGDDDAEAIGRFFFQVYAQLLNVERHGTQWPEPAAEELQ